MRSLPLVALGLAGLGVSAHVGHRHRDVHKKREQVTEIETFVKWITSTVYDDGPSSSSSEDAVFFEKTSSTATPSPPPPVETPSLPAPKAQVALPSSIVTTSSPPPVPTSSQPETTAAVQASIAVSVGIGGGSGSGSPPKQGERVMTIVNKHSAAITTAHMDTFHPATSNGEILSHGTMAPGGVSVMTVSNGWVGNVAVNSIENTIVGQESLIEANYGPWMSTGKFALDMDVSFVNGFTLPITCSCGGDVVTGCSLDLHALGSCPIENGACVNKDRADFSLRAASNFFAPCEGAAWTFVEDGKSDSQCFDDDAISCCIGSSCPPSHKQKSK